jgi:uncharacterized pyridoxamine 5'-phosphate oxidase family protein
MKIKKINENFENEYIRKQFYFLSLLGEVEFERQIEFLKSLNLKQEQYQQLSNLFEDFGLERYSEGDYGDPYNEDN